MDGYLPIMSKDYFDRWHCQRIKFELRKPIGQSPELTPVEEFAGFIMETGIRYNIPLMSHVTMNSIDNNGRALWVYTYNETPLLLGDLYNRRAQSTLDKTFDTLVQSNDVLEFGIGTQIVINYFITPEGIRDQFNVLWQR